MLAVNFYGKFVVEEQLTRGQEIFGGAAIFGAVALAGYLWWTHEPAPKDHCAELRKVFDQVKLEDIRGALDKPARLVVVETPDAEDGLPCDVELAAVEP